MTFTKISTKEFEYMEETNSKFSGIMFVYKSNYRGEVRKSALHLGGAEFTPISGTQDEMFRTWKNVISAFWCAALQEEKYKEDNAGIKSKLSGKCPSEIIVCSSDCKTQKRWDVAAMVWEKIGLLPTKKDMEACKKEYKKKIHKAALASFDALKFRMVFHDGLVLSESEAKAQETVVKQAKKTSNQTSRKKSA